MEAARIALGAAFSQAITPHDSCVEDGCQWLRDREFAKLQFLLGGRSVY
jgi:hypothetical protein